MKSVFEETDYLKVIQEKLEFNSTVRGYQTQLARAMKMQTSTFSRVIGGTLHFTREQAADLAEYWKFSKYETQYFLLLVDYARAGTTKLKSLIEEEMNRIKDEVMVIFRKTKTTHSSKAVDEVIFGASWEMRVIHAMVGTTHFNTANTISTRLNLPLDQVSAVLMQMSQMGLIKESKSHRWTNLNPNYAISYPAAKKTATLISRHKAIESVISDHADDFHLTGVLLLNQDTFESEKSSFKELAIRLGQGKNRMGGSAYKTSERATPDAYCLAIDLFRA